MDPQHCFYPSRIPDPTTATKEEGGKIVLPFFVASKFTKIVNYSNKSI
jgi:hypothetical protein